MAHRKEVCIYGSEVEAIEIRAKIIWVYCLHDPKEDNKGHSGQLWDLIEATVGEEMTVLIK